MAKVTNSEHRQSVIAKVYQDAVELDWLHVGNRRRTQQYGIWLEDPEVGGVLAQWMGRGEMRVWLKDGVMKEFKRAMAGQGPFSDHLVDQPFGAANVVRRTLGEEWAVVGEVHTKPLRCVAERNGERRELVWGLPGDLKHLMWAALEEVFANPEVEPLVVVLETLARPVAPAHRRWFEFVARRVNLELRYTSV